MSARPMIPINYALRPVTLADAPALHRCWPQYSADGVQIFLSRVMALMQQARALGLVAVDRDHGDGDALPFAYGQVTRWPHVAEISDLSVIETRRGQGVGTALIAALSDAARGWPLAQVEIGVALGNPRALALYRRLGFSDDRMLTFDLGRGAEPVLYLTRPLSPHTHEAKAIPGKHETLNPRPLPPHGEGESP